MPWSTGDELRANGGGRIAGRGFGHQIQGAAAAQRVLSGLLLGLFSFAGFFFVLAIAIEDAGIIIAFTAAIGIALGIQATSLWIVRRRWFAV